MLGVDGAISKGTNSISTRGANKRLFEEKAKHSILEPNMIFNKSPPQEATEHS